MTHRHINGTSIPVLCGPLVGREQRRVCDVSSPSRDLAWPVFQQNYADQPRRTAPQAVISDYLANGALVRLRERQGPGSLFPGSPRSQTVREMAHGHRPALPHPIHVGGLVQDGVCRLHPASVACGVITTSID